VAPIPGRLDDVPTTSARLLALLALLQTRRDWSGTVLADRLDVSLRTVRRDVDRLRELGYPITATLGPDGGYRLSPGADLPPLLLDDDQTVALAVALQVAAAGPSPDLAEPAARVLTTLRQVLPARLRGRVDTVRVSAVGPPAEPVDAGVLLALSAAAQAHETVRFDYGGAGDGPSRRAEPHHVVTAGGRWYLVAWDLDRAGWRTFRVDRIALRTPNGPRFPPRGLPGGDVAAYLAGRFRGSRGADGGWPCRGTVLLDLPVATVARFSHEAVVEEVGPDRCRVTLGSWSWGGLAAEVARFDADVRVEGPPELADACARLARRFAAAAPG
jgi:predicted DNA-binding transcriptional regulator YafY